ncbi:MAG: sigma-54 dependent transcriptional regulator [Myxococcota bacterium]
MGRVLVVDDETGLRDALEVLVSSRGHQAFMAAGVEQAQQILQSEHLDLVITDLRLEPGGDGIEVVRTASASEDRPQVIVMTAYGTREKAQRAIAEGASFYLEKGPHLASDIEVLMRQAINTRQLQEENAQLRRALTDQHGLHGLVGKSPGMLEVKALVERLAPAPGTVLISGESGTGKERVARALHAAGPIASAPFVPLNCGAVPENLLESELFGYVKGAFTGADTDKPGLFEAARGGTIFLDEIAELPVALQPKLLRVLQEHRFKQVGAVEERSMEARVIAATNRDLESEVKAGRFREDLYFRLNVLPIEIPPLRERYEDIPLLAHGFLARFSKAYRREVTEVSPDAMDHLLRYHFPGNVRQLENIIERGVALATGTRLTAAQLPKEVVHAEARREPAVVADRSQPFPEAGVDLERLVEDFEYDWIGRALTAADGVKTRAAELLGLTFRQFRYKVSKYERRRQDG